MGASGGGIVVGGAAPGRVGGIAIGVNYVRSCVPGSAAAARSAIARCRSTEAPALQRECELRATVDTASRCLPELPVAQQRVLTLRAGVGAGPPRSRGGVARRLRITERRVVRLERSGLRQLRILVLADACAAPQPAQPPPAAGAVAPGSPAAATTTNSSTPPERADGRGGDRSGDDSPEIGAPALGGIAGEPLTNGTRADLTLPIILLVLALIAAAAAVVLRRNPSIPPPAEAPREPDEPGQRPVRVPTGRSTLGGPGWTAEPEPSSDDAGGWASAPGAEPEPAAPRRRVDAAHPPPPSHR